MIGPVCELQCSKYRNKRCCKFKNTERLYIAYFIFCVILFLGTLIYDFMFWQSQLNIAVLLIGCIYFMVYSIIDASQNQWKYGRIAWLYIGFGMIIICGAVITQYLFNDACKLWQDEHGNIGFMEGFEYCPFDDRFNNNAIWNLCQIIGCGVLFSGIVYEEHTKMRNSVYDRDMILPHSPMSGNYHIGGFQNEYVDPRSRSSINIPVPRNDIPHYSDDNSDISDTDNRLSDLI